MTIVNIDLFTQDKIVQSNDTIGRGKIILFKVVGIADTTKANMSGLILDCKDSQIVGGTLISFYNIKTSLKTDYCCTDSSGNFKLWLDYGYYKIKFSTLGYYDYEINNIFLGSGNLIDSKFCVSQKPKFKLDKPIIMNKCYRKIDKNNK